MASESIAVTPMELCSMEEPPEGVAPMRVALFGADGEPIGIGEATADTAGLVRQAAHVDGASGTVADVVSALVASGIMAES